jgi:hypothetical protein
VASDFADGGMLCKGVEFFLEVGSDIIADALYQAEVLDGFEIGESGCGAGPSKGCWR